MINFCTGYFDGGGLYIDDIKVVGRNATLSHIAATSFFILKSRPGDELAGWKYLKTPSKFLFDLVTSVPFSYYDLILYYVSRAKSSLLRYSRVFHASKSRTLEERALLRVA